MSRFIRLFSSYLDERSQCVKLNNIYLGKIVVSYSVPKGSVLGPLLFILFVSDMPISKVYGTPFLFADDIAVYLEYCQWSDLSPSRCKSLPFRTSFFDNSFILGDSDLLVVDNIKDLDFMITHNINWNSHMDHK